jgi:hypothetical protein
MRPRLRSLQAQLAFRLSAVILIATALSVGVIVYEGFQAADALGNEELLARAHELARRVVPDAAGTVRVDLIPRLQQHYRAHAETDIFLLQNEAGATIAASGQDFAAVAGGLPRADFEPHYFRLERFGPNQEDYASSLSSMGSDDLPLLGQPWLPTSLCFFVRLTTRRFFVPA